MATPDNKEKMLRGELYYAFTPELVAERRQCEHACARFNAAGEVSRRERAERLNEYIYPFLSSRRIYSPS
jgi:hypothetical protein